MCEQWSNGTQGSKLFCFGHTIWHKINNPRIKTWILKKYDRDKLGLCCTKLSRTSSLGFRGEYLPPSVHTWLAHEVTPYFTRRVTAVTACLLDCCKSFDKCRFNRLSTSRRILHRAANKSPCTIHFKKRLLSTGEIYTDACKILYYSSLQLIWFNIFQNVLPPKLYMKEANVTRMTTGILQRSMS